MQRALADTNDQLQITFKEAAQIAEENNRHLTQIGDLEEALESTNRALVATNAACQEADDRSKQVADLSQQILDEKEATKNQTGQLALQVVEIRSQAFVASKLAEELAQKLNYVKCRLEDAINQAKATNYFADGIAVDLSKHLENKLDQDAGFFRQLEEARNEAKAASDLAAEVEAVKKDLKGARNSADDLSWQLKDAQTQAELAARLVNGVKAEFTNFLEDVKQLCNTKEQSESAGALGERIEKALSKQLEDAKRETDNATSEIRGIKIQAGIQVEAANRLVESAGQALARYIGEAKRQVEAASSRAHNVAADAREIIAGDQVMNLRQPVC